MIYTLDFFAAQDTVFTIVSRDALQTASDISLVVMAVGSGVVLIAVAVVLLQIRKLLRTLNEQVKPVTERAKVAAENVEYISAVVREDVQRVHDSIGAITERLHDASDHIEDRVQEFNALMEVVQGEAERVFIDTAATVRGVQAGARSMGRSARQDGSGNEGGQVTRESEAEDDAKAATDTDFGGDGEYTTPSDHDAEVDPGHA